MEPLRHAIAVFYLGLSALRLFWENETLKSVLFDLVSEAGLTLYARQYLSAFRSHISEVLKMAIDEVLGCSASFFVKVVGYECDIAAMVRRGLQVCWWQ